MNQFNIPFATVLTTTVLTFSLGACAGLEESSPELVRQALDNSPTDLGETSDFPRGSKVVMAPEYEQQLVDSNAGDSRAVGSTTIIYMNRVGGVFSPGQNDASSNRSTLVEGTVNFPAANLNDTEWNQIMGCVSQQFSQFDIEVTDTDPGQVPHFESVVAGRPQLLGLAENVGGVSPFTSNCDVIPNSIVFTFTDVLPRNPQRICEVAAQEIAHSFGLDHEFLCSDPMSYLTGCGAKSFQDVEAPCGEGAARDCARPGKYDCGYDLQNSVQIMRERIGLREGAPANDVVIAAPIDGATVNRGFEVNAAVDFANTVELRIDGISIATLSSGPFLFSTPSDLDIGTHIVEIVATTSGVATTKSVSINLVDSGGGDPDGSEPDGSDPDGERGQDDTPQVLGGCASGGSSGSGCAALLLGLVLFTLRRRKILVSE